MSGTPRSSPPTVEQIDRALAEWQAKVALAGANLLELDDVPALARLRGGPSPPAVTGVTQAHVAPALAALGELWQDLSQLTEVVERAAALRRALPRLWPSERALAEIAALLDGPSVALPPVAAPLAQRGLLTAAERAQSLTPARVLLAMTEAFDLARREILAVDAAWNRLESALADADRQADALQALAASLGAEDALAPLRRRVAALRAQVGADPLGVGLGLDLGIAPLLQDARTRLDGLARQRDGVAADLRRAAEVLAALGEAGRRCQESYEECRAQVAGPGGPQAPQAADGLPDLDRWLQSLDAAWRGGRWRPARVGLDRWLPQAQARLDAERAADAANRALLEQRAELRGLLLALRAKAGAYAARGAAPDPVLPALAAPDPVLPALAAQAGRLLDQRPTPLEEASRAVAAYEARLAQCLGPP